MFFLFMDAFIWGSKRNFSGPLNNNMITSIEDINPCRVLLKMRIYPLPQFQTPRSTWRNGLGNDTRYPNTGRACWISRMNRPLKPMTTQPRRHQGGNMIWSVKRNIIFWRLNIYAICRFESIWMIVINLDEETHSKSHWSINIPSWSAILAHFFGREHTHNHYPFLSL